MQTHLIDYDTWNGVSSAEVLSPMMLCPNGFETRGDVQYLRLFFKDNTISKKFLEKCYTYQDAIGYKIVHHKVPTAEPYLLVEITAHSEAYSNNKTPLSFDELSVPRGISVIAIINFTTPMTLGSVMVFLPKLSPSVRDQIAEYYYRPHGPGYNEALTSFNAHSLDPAP